MTVTGSPHDLEAFRFDFCIEIAPLTEAKSAPEVSLGEKAETTSDFYSFGMPGKPDFSAMKTISEKHPDVVICVAGVEFANRYAEAAVIKNGDVVGEYSMDEAELSEFEGPDGEEDEVFDNLFATVEAYRSDTVEAMSSSLPFLGRVFP